MIENIFDVTFDDLHEFTFDDLHDFNDFKESTQLKNDTSEKDIKKVKIFLDKWDIRKEKIKDATYLILNNVLTDLILPLPGEQLRIRTQQQINLFSIILKILETHKKIDELTIVTYTLNKVVYSVLIDLLKKNHIGRLNLFLASAYIFRDKEYYEKLKNEAAEFKDKYDYHLVFAWLHLKISLVKCGGNFYQFEGSMNYSSNNMAEQILFENNKITYDHDYNFISKIITNHDNKALEIIC